MFISLSEIDLVEVLNLDKTLSSGEIDILLDSLTKEIFFRLLHDKLPKLLNKEDFKYLNEKYKIGNDIDEIMDEITKKWPNLDIEIQLKEVGNQVKKDFIKNYLGEMKGDYSDKELHHDIDKLLAEISKEQINKDLCLEIKERMGRKINTINKKY